jgi:hypothetical protein
MSSVKLGLERRTTIFVIDPDTPEDIEKLQKRLGLVLKLPQPSHPVMAS